MLQHSSFVAHGSTMSGLIINKPLTYEHVCLFFGGTLVGIKVLTGIVELQAITNK